MVAQALAVCALNPYHWGEDALLEDVLADERDAAPADRLEERQARERVVQGLERLDARGRDPSHAVRSRSPQADDLARWANTWV